MRALRAPLVVALALLVLSQRMSGRPMDENVDESARCCDNLLERITQSTSEKERALEREDAHGHGLKTESGEQILEIFPRDLRKKEKFLKHLTGPLYFSPKCRKHVYRLYHNTRDCTIPAYYKRCARLLTRLAGSPRCLES
ncbi:ALK and LTK ligand 2-like [Colossoma macropomum]|uniref:ALK and LTK ligand 2-like n=1 Tax=Colossoma macropomum TaxID=42526 RepID=UPI001863E2A5|nr:ALK and LTK ligand 2-like [Colossoma macropomum]XP_036448362.1 ALK and LTK ligand 2-like [Colossoma macropomum]XP_036448363.1 ALK and LTK ligand 2-like [Colossoma macropomum]